MRTSAAPTRSSASAKRVLREDTERRNKVISAARSAVAAYPEFRPHLAAGEEGYSGEFGRHMYNLYSMLFDRLELRKNPLYLLVRQIVNGIQQADTATVDKGVAELQRILQKFAPTESCSFAASLAALEEAWSCWND